MGDPKLHVKSESFNSLCSCLLRCDHESARLQKAQILSGAVTECFPLLESKVAISGILEANRRGWGQKPEN